MDGQWKEEQYMGQQWKLVNGNGDWGNQNKRGNFGKFKGGLKNMGAMKININRNKQNDNKNINTIWKILREIVVFIRESVETNREL